MAYRVSVVVIQSLNHVQHFATHGLQHARLPCPSLSPGVCSNSFPLSWWCHPTISSGNLPPVSLRNYCFSFRLVFRLKSRCFAFSGAGGGYQVQARQMPLFWDGTGRGVMKRLSTAGVYQWWCWEQFLLQLLPSSVLPASCPFWAPPSILWALYIVPINSLLLTRASVCD